MVVTYVFNCELPIFRHVAAGGSYTFLVPHMTLPGLEGQGGASCVFVHDGEGLTNVLQTSQVARDRLRRSCMHTAAPRRCV